MNSVDNSIAVLSAASLTTYALISASFVWDTGYGEFRGRTSELPFTYVTREARNASQHNARAMPEEFGKTDSREEMTIWSKKPWLVEEANFRRSNSSSLVHQH